MGFVAGRGEEVKWPVQWSYSGGLMWRSCYKNKREDGGWAGSWGSWGFQGEPGLSAGVFRGEMLCAILRAKGQAPPRYLDL